MLIWANGGFRLFADDGTGEAKETLWNAPNGHFSFLPGTQRQWLVSDTYPQGPQRQQIVYLFHRPTKQTFVLGRFVLPKAYSGMRRCDTHPRVSRDGKSIFIDSAHGGNGRQQYLIDITRIVDGAGIGASAAPAQTGAAGHRREGPSDDRLQRHSSEEPR